MASTLSSPSIQFSITGSLASGAVPATNTGTVNDTLNSRPAVGSSAGQVNKLYSATLSVGAATKSVASLTRSSTTATATVTSHGYSNGDEVTIAGAAQTEYNGTVVIGNVTTHTFDYTVSGSPATPATGTITARKVAYTVLDLTSLTDQLGASITFSAIQDIKITNKSTTTGENITYGPGDDSNPLFANTSELLKGSSSGNATGGYHFGTAEKTVDSSHKTISLLAAAGSAVSVTVTIVGR